jgi:predicted nuclease of predicted toxin-antitoxin system
VRFLVDENLPSRFAECLRQAGHEASHVVDHDLRGAPDDVVMALARREHAVVVTYDADFAALLVRGGEQLPSVVLFRDQRRRPEQLAERLLENLSEIKHSLSEGAIAVFDPARIRIRALPSNPGH